MQRAIASSFYSTMEPDDPLQFASVALDAPVETQATFGGASEPVAPPPSPPPAAADEPPPPYESVVMGAASVSVSWLDVTWVVRCVCVLGAWRWARERGARINPLLCARCPSCSPVLHPPLSTLQEPAPIQVCDLKHASVGVVLHSNQKTATNPPSPSLSSQPIPGALPPPPVLPLYEVTVSDPVKHGEGVSVSENGGGC